MSISYLDSGGLSYFWDKIKSYVTSLIPSKYADSPSAGGNATVTNGILKGAVDSTSTSTAFTATVSGLTSLYDGVAVYLTNGVVTSASGFTININNLGAKPVYSSMAAETRITTVFNISYTMLFIYNSSRVDGGCWDMYYGYYSDANTLGYMTRWNGADEQLYSNLGRYRLCFTMADGKIMPMTTNTATSATTNKTINTASWNPFQPIYYYATTTIIEVGTNVSNNYLFDRYTAIDLRYSQYPNSTIAAHDNIYIKCKPVSGSQCLVQFDSNAPITTTLPSSDDGYVYVFLGVATSTYQMLLYDKHPIYYYKNGALQHWVGVDIPTVPTNVSAFTNDAGYLTSYTETDPTVPSWAKASSKPSYTASEVGADASGTAASAVNTHNSSSTAHSDIRNAIPTNVSDLTNDAGYTTNVGTITGITMNGTSKGTSGVVDLGTVITAHQDISGKLDKSGGTMTGALTLSGGPTNNLHAATKKYVDDLDTAMDARMADVEAAVGSGGSVDDKITAAIEGLDSSVSATSGSVLTGVTITDGELSGKTEVALDAPNVGYTPEANSSFPSTVSTVKGALDSLDSKYNRLDVGKAPYNSPALTGTPTAPTATAGTNTTQIATTAFVTTAIANAGGGDMTMSVYDADEDGVVDKAEAVSNISGSGGIEFGLDANGKGQYRAVGASTWIPFLSGPTYTRFWTNESPTSNFAAQDVNFSYDAAIYDALRIVWEYNKNTGATADTWESSTNTISTTYDLSNGKISNYVSGNSKIYMGVVNYASSYAYMRRCWFVPIDDQWSPRQLYIRLHFDQVYRANNANNDTGMLIPLLIDGVKY